MWAWRVSYTRGPLGGKGLCSESFDANFEKLAEFGNLHVPEGPSTQYSGNPKPFQTKTLQSAWIPKGPNT